MRGRDITGEWFHGRLVSTADCGRHGTAEKHAARVSAELTAAEIKHMVVDQGEVNKPFRGGAGVRQNSHWFVVVKV